MELVSDWESSPSQPLPELKPVPHLRHSLWLNFAMPSETECRWLE
jgi:hypothetical protein